MERTVSAEERMRRAEEIYYRRRLNNKDIRVSSANVNTGKEKRRFSPLKKMVLQILVCVVIYVVFYVIQNNNYIFSADVVNKTQEFLKTDINFEEVSNQVTTFFQNNQQYFNFLGTWFNGNGTQEESNITNEQLINETVDDNNTEVNEQINNENNTEESEQTKNNTVTNNEQVNNKDNNATNTTVNNEANNEVGVGGSNTNEETIEASASSNTNKTQMELDAEYIKKNFSMQLPLKGTITSRYGKRVPTEIISENHRGIDIGVDEGTTIVASMEGTVSVVSDEGDYGTHVKIVNKDVMTVYAHCSKILVKEGDKIKKGQKIALSGNTGNSTGPHLHFEVRRDERTVDPELILNWN